MRLAVLYGPRRSELLALRWDVIGVIGRTVRIDEGLVPLGNGILWSQTKNARSRRVIAFDTTTADRLARHRREQLEERLLTGAAWQIHNLLVGAKLGKPVQPRFVGADR